MGLTANQGLGYCLDEIEPVKFEDELVRILLYAAILRVGLRLGISPLTGNDPFSTELRDEVEACWAGLSRDRLASLGASSPDIEALVGDVGQICQHLGISSTLAGES
jgi:hypothetical protein